jgi:LysM repeat protein
MNRTFSIVLVAGCITAVVVAFIFCVTKAGTSNAPTSQKETIVSASQPSSNPDPLLSLQNYGIPRLAQLTTKSQNNTTYKITEYKVRSGDSLWSIGRQFNLKPETILWGNEWLSNVGVLQIDDTLNILPVDGVLHTVQEGDTLEKLQILHGTPAQEIFEYLGNNFDLTQPPQLTPGQQIIIPNGTSPILWPEAQAPSVVIDSDYSGPYPNLGTGSFVWPVAPPYDFTQEYWAGHPAIDLGTYFRQPIFASDTGTVIFAGWSKNGYGNLVIIEHGNGYRTYYAHNESILVSVGEIAVQGQQIAESGSTGNSTGDHLDFRVMYNGQFFNPLEYLP